MDTAAAVSADLAAPVRINWALRKLRSEVALRRLRSELALSRLRNELAFGVVLVVVLGGFLAGWLAPGHWLRGVVIMAFGFWLACAFRLTLPRRWLGMIAIRGRYFDAACYFGCGSLIVVFAILLPK
ncbi:MAG TPA: DUF3017 domain-containing protein [Jatrophihabitantaceae bacterium]|nr:DUF3017 domain-containing protein [Jatrophihabitantaceae bacterium]